MNTRETTLTSPSHTPGPWHVTGKHYVHARIRAGDIDIAMLAANGHAQRHGMANAQLIAAAPELLDCLEELLSDIEQLSDEFAIVREIRDSSYGRAARAALAKAKGGAA